MTVAVRVVWTDRWLFDEQATEEKINLCFSKLAISHSFIEKSDMDSFAVLSLMLSKG